ncbi:MAG: Levodione reductase, partial [Actinomycetota bacterium]
MSTPRPLDGQVALVTGAGSGLGAAFARRLHADGATVIVNDLSADAASAVAISVDGDVAVFDVVDAEAFDTEVDKAVERHGRLDIVINNAGIAPPSDPDRTQRSIANQMLRMEGRVGDMTPPDSLVSMTDAEWDRMIRVHLYGTFHGTRAALRHMTP